MVDFRLILSFVKVELNYNPAFKVFATSLSLCHPQIFISTLSTLLVKTLMKTLNSNRSRTDPFATPLDTNFQFDSEPFRTTLLLVVHLHYSNFIYTSGSPLGGSTAPWGAVSMLQGVCQGPGFSPRHQGLGFNPIESLPTQPMWATGTCTRHNSVH